MEKQQNPYLNTDPNLHVIDGIYNIKENSQLHVLVAN